MKINLKIYDDIVILKEVKVFVVSVEIASGVGYPEEFLFTFMTVFTIGSSDF